MAAPLKANIDIGLNVGDTPTVSFSAMPGDDWTNMSTSGEDLSWTENTGGPSLTAHVGNTVVWPYGGAYNYYYWPYESTDYTGKAFNVARQLMVEKVVKIKSPDDFVKLVQVVEKALRVA